MKYETLQIYNMNGNDISIHFHITRTKYALIMTMKQFLSMFLYVLLLIHVIFLLIWITFSIFFFKQLKTIAHFNTHTHTQIHSTDAFYYTHRQESLLWYFSSHFYNNSKGHGMLLQWFSYYAFACYLNRYYIVEVEWVQKKKRVKKKKKKINVTNVRGRKNLILLFCCCYYRVYVYLF